MQTHNIGKEVKLRQVCTAAYSLFHRNFDFAHFGWFFLDRIHSFIWSYVFDVLVKINSVYFFFGCFERILCDCDALIIKSGKRKKNSYEQERREFQVASRFLCLMCNNNSCMFFVINWKWMAIFWHIVETYREFTWGCFVALSAATLFKLDYHFYWGYFISVAISLTAISICTKNANRIVNSASTITSSCWYAFSHYATSCTIVGYFSCAPIYSKVAFDIFFRLFPFWFRMVFFGRVDPIVFIQFQ